MTITLAGIILIICLNTVALVALAVSYRKLSQADRLLRDLQLQAELNKVAKDTDPILWGEMGWVDDTKIHKHQRSH